MRGTHLERRTVQLGVRFIPAFAGNTRPSRARRRRRSVHPRVCGEHRPVHRQGACGVGSSPRLRGTRAWCRSRRPDRRFIPAFAGNTSASATCLSIVTVHPRVCGEHECFCTNHCPHAGSSPRLRGTPDRGTGRGLRGRFIPAFAGNTCHGCHRSRPAAVHPRVCGEHPTPRFAAARITGSSPRLRGTRLRSAGGQLDHRFIPAFAGNTIHHAAFVIVITVHPRVCGEHLFLLSRRTTPPGSSPRLRGTPLPNPEPL